MVDTSLRIRIAAPSDPNPRRAWRPVLAAVLVTALGLAVLQPMAKPDIEVDGVGYYAPLASWLFDHDFDLQNELSCLNSSYIRAMFMTPEGRLGDPFHRWDYVRLWSEIRNSERQLQARRRL